MLNRVSYEVCRETTGANGGVTEADVPSTSSYVNTKQETVQPRGRILGPRAATFRPTASTSTFTGGSPRKMHSATQIGEKCITKCIYKACFNASQVPLLQLSIYVKLSESECNVQSITEKGAQTGHFEGEPIILCNSKGFEFDDSEQTKGEFTWNSYTLTKINFFHCCIVLNLVERIHNYIHTYE